MHLLKNLSRLGCLQSDQPIRQEDAYLKLLGSLYMLKDSEINLDRTGVGTYKIFGPQISFDLKEGFPLLTTKKLHLKSIIHELLWFIDGDTNIKYLNDNGVSIWDEWADEGGNLGPIYGAQWRSWFVPQRTQGIDQLSDAVDLLRNSPESRRIIVTAWNPADIPDMALPPCHCFFQLSAQKLSPAEKISYAHEHHFDYAGNDRNDFNRMYKLKGYPEYNLSIKVYMRSVDVFLGLPFNIASYAFLLTMIAKEVRMIPRNLVMTFGDAHLYSNHVEQAAEQLTRLPKKPPTFELFGNDLYNHKFEDFLITDYDPYPSIAAPIAV